MPDAAENIELEVSLGDGGQEIEVESVAPKVEKSHEPPAEPDDLSKRLASLEKAEEEKKVAEAEIDRLRRQNAELEQRRREAEDARGRVQDERDDAYQAGIINAIEAATANEAAATRALKAARDSGDFEAEVVAIRELNSAMTDRRLAEQYKNEYEQIKKEKATAKPEAPPKPKTWQDTLEDMLANSSLNNTERDWVRKHPEVAFDQRKSAHAQMLHDQAATKFQRGTPEYFAYMDEGMGYSAPKEIQTVTSQPSTSQKKAPAAAPPTREATSPVTGRPANTKVTLTPEQQEVAINTCKRGNMTNEDAFRVYAEGVLRLRQAKNEGRYVGDR